MRNSRPDSPSRNFAHQLQDNIFNQDKINSWESCPHISPDSVDNFIEKLIDITYNTCHYHTLAGLLTPTHAECLKNFKVTKIQSHIHSNCYLRKRLAQAYRQILDSRITKPSRWFSYEWTLLSICLSHKYISRRLNPHQRYKRFSLTCKVINQPILLDLTPDYKTGIWKLNRELLRRQINHYRKTKNFQLTYKETLPLIEKRINLAQERKELPRVLRLPWIKEKLLDPQNLLLYGKEKLKKDKVTSHGIITQDKVGNQDSTLTLRMANIRSLTKEKLQIDRATESLLNSTPDVYIYTETRQDPTDDYLKKYKQIFHSSTEEGKGGTTVLVSNKIPVIYSETKIPDTVMVVLQKGNANIILTGTYLSHRLKDKYQKLALILEMISKLAERYSKPTVLLFGDLNMYEQTVRNNLQKQNHLLAKLELRIVDNYASPPNFPPLTTRKGTNKHNEPVYNRLDYIITNGDCIVRTEYAERLSDHIFFNLKLDLKQSSVRRVQSTDRNKLNRELATLMMEDISSVLSFIKDNLHTYRKSRTCKPYGQDPIIFHISQDYKRLIKEWMNDYRSFAKSTTDLRFSTFQGLAFRLLRSITKYDQLQKRDGSVINAIKDENGNTITDPNIVSKALIDHLRQNDSRFLDRKYNDWNYLPTLPKPTLSELSRILSKINQHKALTKFPVPDEYFRLLLKNDCQDAIKSLWDPETINKFPEIFNCKLIPLNKVHPNVPTALQMRPIVATNVLFKILELRFSDELHEKFWNLKGFALSQFGFLRNMNTQAQIYNLLNQATQGWKRPQGKMLHCHQPSLNPLLPKYDPDHHYIIFIDFKEAYNSINMGLLYEMMKKDKVIEEDKLTYLFTIYSKLRISLNKEDFTPKNGVPQGGINSPILFNYAMFYFLSEAATKINLRIQQLCGFPHIPKIMSPENNFLWADDLATLIKAHPNRAKDYIKIYFEVLIEVGQKWGLTINFNKSAVMDLFSRKVAYKHLSDDETSWDKEKGTMLKLNISPNREQITINLPLVTEYKYLGIRITRDFQPTAHIQGLKKKINYLVNAFKSVGGASQSLKFCVNTWQVFIRPLLDYSQTYFSFLEDRHREMLNSLYRESARKMMFLKSYTPNSLVDRLIQYNYRELHQEYYRVAKNKTDGRKNDPPNSPRLVDKVDYKYNRIDLTDIPLKWAKVWNMLYYPHRNQIDPQLITKVLKNLGEVDIKQFMNNFLVSSIKKLNKNKLDDIYIALLSTLETKSRIT